MRRQLLGHGSAQRSHRSSGDGTDVPGGVGRAKYGPSIEEAWRVCGDLFCQTIEMQIPLGRGDPQREILFCLLGGFGITYEHNRSAAEAVAELEPFAGWWDDDELFEAIVSVLSLARFEPARRNGNLRRYRFPRRKAMLIVSARRWLLLHHPLDEWLLTLASEKDRREFLCRCPGIGPKTASWVLRNLGWAKELAVLDVHLVRALSEADRVADDVHLPRDYDVVEEAFLRWCRELAAPPAAFDLFVWEWQRGSLWPK
jgi:hypothetical protein